MIRQTGGWAWGATSTRSRSRSWARRRASWVETIPIWAPSGPTRRTWGARILSFMRGSTETPHHLPICIRVPPQTKSTDASPALGTIVNHAQGSIGAGYDGCRDSSHTRKRPAWSSGRLRTQQLRRGDGTDVRGLFALGPVHDVELDLLP